MKKYDYIIWDFNGTLINDVDLCFNILNTMLSNRNIKTVIVAGGVAANNGLRTKLTEICNTNNINVTFPTVKYSTDNAAMIATAGYFAYLEGRIAETYEINSKSTMELK